MTKIKIKRKKVKVDKTTPKQLKILKEVGFQPGQSGNPKGRPKGTRNKFGEAFLKDFMAEWETGGAEALQRVRVFDPATFIKVAASILPKEIKVNDENATLESFLDKFKTIEEIDEFIKGVSAIGNGDGFEKEEDQIEVRSQSDIIH